MESESQEINLIKATNLVVFKAEEFKTLKMKNNYKQLLSKSPSESSVFKRSASQSLRSSFRLPKKRSHIQAVSCSSLPTYVPPKAAALLEISMPPLSSKQSEKNFIETSSARINPQPLKVATIRRRSVWANSSASKTVIR